MEPGSYGPFKYKRLRDPSEHIRLLRWTGTLEDGWLTFELIAYKFDKAPLFSAISYEWGPADDDREILINGNRKLVRWNCYYALLQATLKHDYEAESIWIDSVSINQQDSEERSAQVALMPEIYTRALRVLACIGPHADQSEQLFGLLEEAIRDSERLSYSYSNKENVPPEYSFLSLMQVGDGLAESFKMLRSRSYWSRLWIIPELANARTVNFLCGPSVVSLSVLSGLVDLMSTGAPSDFLPADKVLKQTRSWTEDNCYWTLQEVCDLFGSAKCVDQRDRIFAFWTNIDWQRSALPRLKPDYNLTAFQIAQQVSRYYSLPALASVLRALEISTNVLDCPDFLPRLDCMLAACHRKRSNGFLWGSELADHLRNAHSEVLQPFDCTVEGCPRCGTQGFSERNQLDKHMQAFHPVTPKLFDCMAENCPPKGANGFTRMDKMIEHAQVIHAGSRWKRPSERSPDR